MRGGALPPALLCAAVGLALSFAPRQARIWAIALMAVAALAFTFAPISDAWRETVFLGCWLSAVLACASVHLPKGLPTTLAVVLGLNAGVWAGAVITVAGARPDLFVALPFLLLSIPGAWLVATGRGIAIKVVGSWIIAAALLAAVLPLVPTPGYMPDHME